VEGYLKRRRAVALVVAVALLAAVAGAIIALWPMPAPTPISPHCEAAGLGQRYALTIDQAENATVIAVAARRLGLADHAVTIGLAAALQESGLVNLDHGDRDSLGLFQQRTSQGWGTPAQIMDPLQSSLSFFHHLARISGWEELPVTVAAQRVQHSAAPDAYADWEGQARVIASVLTGETAAGLTCTYPAVKRPPSSAGLRHDLTTVVGLDPLKGAVDAKSGWLVASWLVAHARQYGLGSVTFAGRRWTPGRLRWKASPPVDMTVRFSNATPSDG
jgi:hypothetical protein